MSPSSPDASASRTTVVTSPKLPKPFGVWSPAILTQDTGRTLHISGLTARDADNNVVGVGDVEEQTRQICRNIQALVEEAGATLDDVASVIVYAVDVTEFDAIHRARREFWPDKAPSSTMVQVVRLVEEQCLIEISATVVLPPEA